MQLQFMALYHREATMRAYFYEMRG